MLGFQNNENIGLAKEFACECRRHGFDPWVRKIPWRRKWQPIPAFLPRKSYEQGCLVGCSLWGHKRVGHDLVTEQWKQQQKVRCSSSVMSYGENLNELFGQPSLNHLAINPKRTMWKHQWRQPKKLFWCTLKRSLIKGIFHVPGWKCSIFHKTLTVSSLF